MFGESVVHTVAGKSNLICDFSDLIESESQRDGIIRNSSDGRVYFSS